MTLIDWQKKNKAHYYKHSSGALFVYSTDKELWHLDDWLVSSVVSGPAVVLVPRKKKNA